MNDLNQIDPLDHELDRLDADGLLQSAFDHSRIDGNSVDVGKFLQNENHKTPVCRKRIVPGTRRSFTSRYVAIGVGACIFAVACLLPFWPDGSHQNSVLAWQDFTQRINDVGTIEYLEVESFPGTNLPTEYRSVMVFGKHRQRVEQVQSKSHLEQLGNGLKELAGIETDENLSIGITDLRTGTFIVLHPEQKQYTLLTHEVILDRDGEQLSKTKVEAHPEIDFYNRLSTIPVDATIDLGKKQIDDHATIGFGIKRKLNEVERDEEYWVDADTLLPVKIIIRLTPNSNESKHGAQTWTLSQFKFDQPLDESLFCTDPPEGYTVEEDSIFSVDMNY